MHTDVGALLIDIEAELRRLGCWEAEPPSAADLASTQPFAVDTLRFPQWLQFIFLPTMHRLVAERAQLPARCGIAPMAEEHFRGSRLPWRQLVAALEAMDALLSEGRGVYSSPAGQ